MGKKRIHLLPERHAGNQGRVGMFLCPDTVLEAWAKPQLNVWELPHYTPLRLLGSHEAGVSSTEQPLLLTSTQGAERQACGGGEGGQGLDVGGGGLC